MTINKKAADFITMILLIIGLSYLYYYTSTFPPSMLPGYPGDAFFPRLVLGFTLICCATVAIKIIRQRFQNNSGASSIGDDSEETITIEPIMLVYMVALVLAFTFLLPVIGFELCTFLYLFTLLITRWFEDLKPKIIKVGLLCLVTTLFFYFSFVVLLNVAFPVKILPAYIQIL